MKRYLHAGEGYSQKSLTYKLLSSFTRYIQTSSPDKFGWLAYPSWVPQVTGIQFLVALFSSMLQHSSRLTRILLVFSSSPSRSVVEAHSKDCRSPLEGLSKRSRTTVEADSNNCRRSVEQVSKKLAKNLLKIQKSIYSVLAGFFSSQLYNVSFGCLSALKPHSKRLWTRALCVCLSVFFLCVHAGVAKEADRGGDGEVVAQFQTDSIKPLQVGDTIPDHLWDLPLGVVNHPEGIKEIRLSDYKGKLIILDFWASWCSVCLAAFPELDSLQSYFDQSIQILLLNPTEDDSQVQANINGIMARNPNFYLPSVPMINGTKTIAKYFPYSQLPHHIWIDPYGKVYAITYGDNTNFNNIKSFFQDNTVVLESKALHSKFDGLLTILSEDNDNQIRSYSIFSNYMPEVRAFSQLKRSKEGLPNRLLCANQSLPQLFATAYGEAPEFSPHNLFFQQSRIIWEVRDSSKFMFPQDPSEYRRWIRDNTYCVDIQVSKENNTNIFKILQDQLETHFPYRAEIEERAFPCWVLSVGDPLVDPLGNDTMTELSEPTLFENKEMQQLLSFLTIAFRNQGIPFVSDDPLTASLTLILDMRVDSPKEWDTLFRKQGMGIRKEIRDIPVLVIKDI